MEKSTYIMIDRNILKWRWYQNPNTMRLFVHLLLKANIRDNDFERITVHRGELVTSYASLSTELGLSVQSIRTALEHLKSTGEVTSKNYAKYQVISILEYDKYQTITTGILTGKQQAINNQSTGNQQQSNNGNNDNNKKNNIYIVEIVRYLNEKTGANFKPTAKDTISHINARIKDGYTVEQFKQVIDKKCADWLTDAKMREYLRPATLFGTKFESYLNSAAVKTIDKTDPDSYTDNDDSDDFLNRWSV